MASKNQLGYWRDNRNKAQFEFSPVKISVWPICVWSDTGYRLHRSACAAIYECWPARGSRNGTVDRHQGSVLVLKLRKQRSSLFRHALSHALRQVRGIPRIRYRPQACFLLQCSCNEGSYKTSARRRGGRSCKRCSRHIRSGQDQVAQFEKQPLVTQRGRGSTRWHAVIYSRMWS